jgi:uncharacterized phiE125 gp8 family phage protein
VNGSWTLVTAPATEPVTLADAKLHLRVTGTAEDSTLALYLQMAREAVEQECWRALLPQTWDLFLPAWPLDGVIYIPRPPLQSVTHLRYIDADGVQATYPASNYLIDTASEPGRLVLAPRCTWPSAVLTTANPIVVRFVAGYANAASVPAVIRAAILLGIADIYANREAAASDKMELTDTVKNLLSLARVRY